MVTRILLFALLVFYPVAASAQTPLPVPAPGTQITIPNTPISLINQSDSWRFEVISADHYRWIGQVEMQVGPQMKFSADQIDVFTDPNLRLVASGNVVFTNPEGRISAESVEFNVVDRTGVFEQAAGIMSLGPAVDRAQFGGQDPDVYFYGQRIEKISAQSYKVTRGGFTTCVQPTPRWEVTSGSVVLNLKDYAIARNMLLRVKGVPLMYLPVIYYPIKDEERATGFLLPTYGNSTLRGQAISNAFFWALGRSQDVTLYHDWFTNTGQGAGAEYRYVSGQSSFGNVRFYRLAQHQAEFRQGGSVSVLPSQTSYQVAGNGNQAIGTNIRLHERVDYASDLVTKQLYQQNVYQASNATRTVEAGLSGTWGGLSSSALFQRTETFTGTDQSQIYGSTPRITGSWAPQRLFGLPVYGSVNSEYAQLPYRTIQKGKVTSDTSLGRMDLAPAVQAALSKLTFLTVNSTMSYRTTYYSRTTDAKDPFLRRYLVMRSDIIGPVFAKIWDTPDSGFSERMKHVIEPAFTVDYATNFANGGRVPILSDVADRVIGGSSRLTYGLNNRFFYRARSTNAAPGATVQYLTIGLQQTYYTNPLSSLTDTNYVSASYHRLPSDLSDVALNVRVTPKAGIDANTRFEYDVQGKGLQVMTTGVSASWSSLNSGTSTATINFSRIQPESSRTPTGSFGGATTLSFLQGRVKGGYALTWDIQQAALLNQGVTLSYLAQCCGIQTEFQKYKYPQSIGPIPSDRRFNVSFVLAGLGTFSNFFGAFGGLMGVGP
jgi:LPS-assembly protein